MRILITGASGLLGTKLSQLATEGGHEVFSAFREHAPRWGKPVKMDLCDPLSVRRAFEKARPEAVVHAAALTNVDLCERERELAWRVNVDGTRAVAEECRRRGCFLVYISTDYVFDGEKGLYREGDPTNPINHYGLTKLKGEEAVGELAPEWCILRPSVIYGSVPASGKVNFALWVLGKLSAGEEIRVVEDQWVSPTLNTALALMALEAIERGITGLYHASGATRVSRLEFAKALAEAFGLDPSSIKPARMEEMKWLARRPRDSSLDVSRAMSTFRNKPLKLREALKAFREELGGLAPHPEEEGEIG